MERPLELQRFTLSDISVLFDWIENTPAFLMQWAGPSLVYPLDIAQMESHFKQLELARSLLFKAIDRTRDEMVGYAVLKDIHQTHHSARISSVLVKPHFRNTGIGTQMIQALLHLGFEELSLHRIDLGVFDFNTAAIRCYERVGFKMEGLQREARKVNTEYWNVCMMSILENEWRESGSILTLS